MDSSKGKKNQKGHSPLHTLACLRRRGQAKDRVSRLYPIQRENNPNGRNTTHQQQRETEEDAKPRRYNLVTEVSLYLPPDALIRCVALTSFSAGTCLPCSVQESRAEGLEPREVQRSLIWRPSLAVVVPVMATFVGSTAGSQEQD